MTINDFPIGPPFPVKTDTGTAPTWPWNTNDRLGNRIGELEERVRKLENKENETVSDGEEARTVIVYLTNEDAVTVDNVHEVDFDPADGELSLLDTQDNYIAHFRDTTGWAYKGSVSNQWR